MEVSRLGWIPEDLLALVLALNRRILRKPRKKGLERVKGIEPSSKFRMSTDVFLLVFFTITPRWTPPDVSTNV
ncbi:MAG: hypothetical protein RIS76_3904, partial [Verrucomicrobiota bacterium]